MGNGVILVLGFESRSLRQSNQVDLPMKALAASIALLLAFVQADAQTFKDYLKLRNAYKITQPVSPEALQTFIGIRVFEIKGVVRGTIGNEEGGALVLETDAGDINIEYTNLPDMLQNNVVTARLLIRAERDTENSMVKAKLLGSATDHEVGAIDEAREKALAAKREKENAKLGSRKAPVRNQRPAPILVDSVAEALPYYHSFIRRRNPRLTDQEALRIAQGILGFSVRFGVDARLIMAMVIVESGFDPNAKSSAGAMGLGQLMPGTARGMGVGNAYDSIENLNATVRLVRGHLEKYSKTAETEYEALALALAAYNAGSGAVRKFGGVPPYKQTQNYIQKVVSTFHALSGK